MDERKVLNELKITYSTIDIISRKLGDKTEYVKLCPNTVIDEILMTITNMNNRLKFICSQINRLNREE